MLYINHVKESEQSETNPELCLLPQDMFCTIIWNIANICHGALHLSATSGNDK